MPVWDGTDGSEYEFGGLAEDDFFAYDALFNGGMFVASADINGDGRDDIITDVDAGGGPHLKVFGGTNLAVIFEWFVFDGQLHRRHSCGGG